MSVQAAEKLLIDSRAAAGMLSISERKLSDLVRRDAVPSTKIDGRRLFSVDGLRVWVQQQITAEGE